MQKITLATGNEHKVKEINLIAKDFNIQFVLPQGEFNPIEDGQNFIENAICKAKCASKNATTDLILADDSGLCVDSLDGAPGIYSARYAPSAQERIEKLLRAMKDKENRNAKFCCAMAVCNKNGDIVFEIQKECFGKIALEQKGQGGFGYDPIFILKDKNITMAQLSETEKSEISHRGQALREVLNWLNKNNV